MIVNSPTRLLAAKQVRVKDCQIALDVGHSAEAPGALSAAGRAEFEFNREFVDALHEALKQSPNPVYIITDINGMLSLPKRIASAEAWGANVLLSIHHDSVQTQDLIFPPSHGRLPGYTDLYSGFSLFISGKQPKHSQSLGLARHIADTLLQIGRSPNLYHSREIRGERRKLLDASRAIYEREDLAILRSSKLISVLLEVGVIVNPKEEQYLRLKSTQSLISDAVAHALIAFCSEHFPTNQRM